MRNKRTFKLLSEKGCLVPKITHNYFSIYQVAYTCLKIGARITEWLVLYNPIVRPSKIVVSQYSISNDNISFV